MSRAILSYRDALTSGVRAYQEAATGAIGFQSINGLRATPWGLRRPIAISQPMTDNYITVTLGTGKSWPYPQFFRGRGVTILAGHTELFLVDESTDPWTASAFPLYDGDLFEYGHHVLASLTGGGPWHFLDMGPAWMLFNGVDVVVRTTQRNNALYTTDSVTIRTGCNHRFARAFLGGFDSSDLYSLFDWGAYWSAKYTNAPVDVKAYIDRLGSTLSGAPGGNWVQFGSIGGGDLLWWLSETMNLRGFCSINSAGNGTFASDTLWTKGTGWSIGSGFAEKTPGSASSLSQISANMLSPYVSGLTYRVRGTITGRTTGSLTPFLDITNGTPVSADGEFDQEIVAGSPATIGFSADASFDGTLDNVSVQLAQNPFQDNFMYEMLQRNEFGFMPMPWQGDVVSMMPLGDYVAVYGAQNASGGGGGVTWLVPAGKYVGTYFVPGFPQSLGVASRGAVGGNEAVHALIDEMGELWVIEPGGAERLGYKEFLSPMLGNEILIAFDEYEREFQFSDANVSYTLTRNGLTRTYAHPTSMFVAQGVRTGLTIPEAEAGCSFSTQPVDAGAAGGRHGDIFILKSIRLRSRDIDATGWSATVYYRMNQRDTWTAYDTVAFSRLARVDFGLPAMEFYVTISHPDVADTNGVDGLQIEVALDGKASTRHWLDAATPAAIDVDS